MLKNNKILGSIFIVAGTAIGGGMVAMPIALSSVGFTVSAFILIVMWVLMYYSSLLMIELYQYHSPYETLTQLAKHYLGKPGQVILVLSMLMLMFSLIAAYITGGGELFYVIGKQYFGREIPSFIYSGVMVGILVLVLVWGTDRVDLLNKLLFTFKLLVLLFILVSMFSLVRFGHLETFPKSNITLLSSLPLVFTAFGFHTCIQSLEIYLQGNKPQLKKVMFAGSLIPLIIYILWVFVIFGSLDNSTFSDIIKDGGGVNSISLTIQQLLGNSYIEIGVKIFVLLAIMTSFLGVSLGSFDYISTGLQLNTHLPGRLFSTILTFFIPILFVSFYPDGFLLALGGAAIAFSLMALVIPVLMVWKNRKNPPTIECQADRYQVRGGSFALLLVFLAGCSIIIIQILILLGQLPKIG